MTATTLASELYSACNMHTRSKTNDTKHVAMRLLEEAAECPVQCGQALHKHAVTAPAAQYDL